MGKMPDYSFYRRQEEYSYLRDVDSVALQHGRMAFDAALKNFFEWKRGNRKGARVGFPKFKRKGVSRDSYATFNVNNSIRIVDGDKFVTLPKIGKVKIVLHRPFDGAIKTVHVNRRRSGRWYVSLTVETDRVEPSRRKRPVDLDNLKVVGLDMSMERFAVSSDADDSAIPKYVRRYRREQKRLARLQRRVSRRKLTVSEIGTEPSRNRMKAQLAYARLSERIADQRGDYAVKTAIHFAKTYDVVVLEDINLQSMARTLRLGKSVNDLGFGEFRRWLEWEAGKYGCYVHYADKWFASSKTCNSCGYRNDGLKLSDREWTCPQCGDTHDRDLNAARNLRDEFLKEYSTAGTAGIDACGDSASTLRETVARALSSKQEKFAVCQSRAEAADLGRG
jgi:putative transposase